MAATAGVAGVMAAGAGGVVGQAGATPNGGVDDAGAAGTDTGGMGGAPPGDQAGGSGAGGTSAGAAGEDSVPGAAGAPDTTPPDIVSVEPSDGATGVRADANIVVTFSEPMDQAETEHAFVSDDLRPSAISFSWSEHGRAMTIHPLNGLEYASAPSPARAYSFSITKFGRDVAGNHLLEDHVFSFMTSVQQTLMLTPVDIRSLVQDGANMRVCTGGSGGISIGDTSDNEGLGALVTFDLSTVPATLSADDVVGATLWATPVLGIAMAISAFHVKVDPSQATWDTPTQADLGVFSREGNNISLDVSSAFIDDLQHAASQDGLSQYVMRFADGSNMDGVAQEDSCLCATLQLELIYWGR